MTYPFRISILVAIAAAVLLVPACSGVVSVPGVSVDVQGRPLPTSRDVSTYTFFLDAHPDAVWFEMQQVFVSLGLFVAEHEVSGERAYLVSERTAIPAEAVHCGARPSGEAPLARSVEGVVRAELDRDGAARTRATLRVEAEGEVLEPNHTRRRSACASRGTLERRIVERTERRLRG